MGTMKGAMVLAVSSRALLDSCEHLGLDVEAMLRAGPQPRLRFAH